MYANIFQLSKQERGPKEILVCPSSLLVYDTTLHSPPPPPPPSPHQKNILGNFFLLLNKPFGK
jgi:hypothetical protein